MIRHVSSTPSCRVKRVLSPTIAACRSTSYGSRSFPALFLELHVELDRAHTGSVRSMGIDHQPDPGRRVELDDELVRLGRGSAEVEPELRRMLEDEA